MVPETPEQVNDARAKNHCIGLNISRPRKWINWEHFCEPTQTLIVNCSFTLLLGTTTPRTVFTANLSLAPFMIFPIVVFEFESKTNRRYRLQTRVFFFLWGELQEGPVVYSNTEKLWAKYPLFNSLFIRHRPLATFNGECPFVILIGPIYYHNWNCNCSFIWYN